MSSKTDGAAARWRKSAHSQNNSACVEFAFAGGLAAIRDSKDRRDPTSSSADQPVISFPASQWEAFLGAVLGNGPAPDKIQITRHPDGNVTVSDTNRTALTFTQIELTAFAAGVADDAFVDVA
ncbi:DUF397 domain-containing protein [Nocardia nova]|uniref:DUF397 domain-containing protein n=1 Tax=Nocardia nova TaxID=37330 RepID=UPI001894C9C8|nr:DUF397 domain-containing protein [Nocardia nova]MBF6150223.1 DUF397 domain-containing protein [Nocardia nova]